MGGSRLELCGGLLPPSRAPRLNLWSGYPACPPACPALLQDPASFPHQRPAKSLPVHSPQGCILETGRLSPPAPTYFRHPPHAHLSRAAPPPACPAPHVSSPARTPAAPPGPGCPPEPPSPPPPRQARPPPTCRPQPCRHVPRPGRACGCVAGAVRDAGITRLGKKNTSAINKADTAMQGRWRGEVVGGLRVRASRVPVHKRGSAVLRRRESISCGMWRMQRTSRELSRAVAGQQKIWMHVLTCCAGADAPLAQTVVPGLYEVKGCPGMTVPARPFPT